MVIQQVRDQAVQLAATVPNQSIQREGSTARQEGTAKISVDVDDKGNVTNVRLARSSGHSALDEAAIRSKALEVRYPNGSRQVVAKVDFAIEGSERSRRAAERRRQKPAKKDSDCYSKHK